jgi:hypothetical protein
MYKSNNNGQEFKCMNIHFMDYIDYLRDEHKKRKAGLFTPVKKSPSFLKAMNSKDKKLKTPKTPVLRPGPASKSASASKDSLRQQATPRSALPKTLNSSSKKRRSQSSEPQILKISSNKDMKITPRASAAKTELQVRKKKRFLILIL